MFPIWHNDVPESHRVEYSLNRSFNVGKDRGAQYVMDVVSVLMLQGKKLDCAYLKRRAWKANVFGLLETLMEKMQ